MDSYTDGTTIAPVRHDIVARVAGNRAINRQTWVMVEHLSKLNLRRRLRIISGDRGPIRERLKSRKNGP
jgi:hypothetical protein